MTVMPRCCRSVCQLSGLLPSSKPMARMSASVAAVLRCRIPDHGIAPRHMLQGSALQMSSWPLRL